MKVEQLDVHQRPVGKPRSGCVLTESLIICEPDSAGKMAVGSQDQQLVLHEVFSTGSGSERQGQSDILDASPLSLGLGSQHVTTIKQELRFWFSLHQVGRLQVAQVDVFACHDLGNKLS